MMPCFVTVYRATMESDEVVARVSRRRLTTYICSLILSVCALWYTFLHLHAHNTPQKNPDRTNFYTYTNNKYLYLYTR